jgi:hypothetical protein
MKKTRNLTRSWVHQFQPVMFDMDPFGGKKVPCTKYQESGITTSRSRGCGLGLHLFFGLLLHISSHRKHVGLGQSTCWGEGSCLQAFRENQHFATVRLFAWNNYFFNRYLSQNIHGHIQVLGTWYREPFCHQIGPYQTLRAENWCTQLLVRIRVFFEFKKSGNHPNGV